MNETFKYYAFISYSHADKKIAKKLQRKLEHYHLPAALQKNNPDLPKKLSPIFIDDSDLVGKGNLKTALQENLDRSNYLIVICSPNSAKSEYVNDEVNYFIKLGRSDHIIPFIVDGVPHSQNISLECFPPAILELPRENELLGIDLKKFGMYEAFLRLIAALLRLDLDDFVERGRKERRRKNIILVSLFFALIIIGFMLVPPPYNETYAENVMYNALASYVRAGRQYEILHKLTDSAINNQSGFKKELNLYNQQISYKAMTDKNSVQYLADMLKTGKVMPSSRQPMSQHECAELLTLADNREEEYKFFASVLEFVMSDDYARKYYSSYPEILRDILEIDSSIAAELYQIVCTPHLTGKYADNSVTAKSYESLFSSVPKQNEHLTGENPKQARESLARFKGSRNDYLQKLNSLGVIDAYKLIAPANPVINSRDEIFMKQSIISDDNKSEARMLNDLLAYIYNREIICKDIKWILDSFENFDRQRTWESLQIARAVVQIARADIIKCKLPPLEMTDNDRQKLMNHKIDVNFLSNLALMFDSEKASELNTCLVLNDHIMRDVFFRDDWAVCMRDADILRQIIDCNIKYLANMADWILTQINNPDETKKFDLLLAKYCPETRANQRKIPDTLNNIEDSAQKILDKLENLVLIDKAKVLGAGNNRFNTLKYVLDNKNLEKLKQNLMTISNMPPLIFSPKWFSDRDIFYFWRENDKIKTTPSPRSEITRVPDICRIKINGISLDKVKAYQQELNNNGVKSLGVKEEADKFTIFYKFKESSFAIIWEDEQVIIFMHENPVCFVPILYLSLMM